MYVIPEIIKTLGIQQQRDWGKEEMPKIIPGIQNRILESARAQLQKGSFADLSLRGVANDCGIALGTTYHYYPSKTELAAAVMEDDWKKETQFLSELDPRTEPVQDVLMKIFLSVRKLFNSYDSILLNPRSSMDARKELVARHDRIVAEISAAVTRVLDLYGHSESPSYVGTCAECILATAMHNTTPEDFALLLERCLPADNS